MSGETQKHRVSWLTVSETFDLNAACKVLQPFGFGTYHVGSSLNRPDYHDVDLRCILADSEFDAMFGGDDRSTRLLFLNTAVSEWLAARTGLPIDFQFQRMTEANEKFDGHRNAVGL